MYTYTKNDVFVNNELIAVSKAHAEKKFFPHTHDFIEIVYILSGSGKQIIDGSTYDVSRGSLLFINYGQTHAFSSDNDMLYYNVLVRPEAFGEAVVNENNAFEILSLTAFEEFQSMDMLKPIIEMQNDMRDKAEYILHEMLSEYTCGNVGSATVLQGYLTVLITYICRVSTYGLPGFDEISGGITNYINRHYKEKLTLETLATKCFYSPKYFSRIFKERYGMNVTDYIQQKRIEEGMRLLRTTLMSVTEISVSIGYSDKVLFHRYFRKYCGMTPLEYRRKNNPDIK